MSFYFHTLDAWFGRCCSIHCKFLDVRPCTEYLLAILITFPSVAVCIVCTFLYIVEVCVCLKHVLADVYTAVLGIFFCSDYIVISNCSVNIAGKDWCYSVAFNNHISDHCLTNFWFSFDDVERYFLRSCKVLVSVYRSNSSSTCSNFFVFTISYLIVNTLFQGNRTCRYCQSRFNLLAGSFLICNSCDCYIFQVFCCYAVFYSLCRIFGIDVLVIFVICDNDLTCLTYICSCFLIRYCIICSFF